MSSVSPEIFTILGASKGVAQEQTAECWNFTIEALPQEDQDVVLELLGAIDSDGVVDIRTGKFAEQPIVFRVTVSQSVPIVNEYWTMPLYIVAPPDIAGQLISEQQRFERVSSTLYNPIVQIHVEDLEIPETDFVNIQFGTRGQIENVDDVRAGAYCWGRHGEHVGIRDTGDIERLEEYDKPYEDPGFVVAFVGCRLFDTARFVNVYKN